LEKKKQFQLVIPSPVYKGLVKLSAKTIKQLYGKLERLSENPFPGSWKGIKKLSLKQSTYRLRVGDYRILYRVHGSDVVLLDVVNRRDLETELKKLR